MKTTVIIAYVGMILVGAVTYFGYNFYSDLALENSCEQLQDSLENVSRDVLFKKAGILSKRFDLGRLDAESNTALSRRTSEIRTLAREKGINMNSAMDLSELEALKTILGEYLYPDGCDIFKNYVKTAQSQFIRYYTIDMKNLCSNLSDDRIMDISMQELSKVDANMEKISKLQTPGSRCGLSNETARILREKEKEYCLALYEHNSGFAISLKESLDDSKDPYSKLYKSALINCLAPCIKNELSCVEECWITQRQVLVGP